MIYHDHCLVFYTYPPFSLSLSLSLFQDRRPVQHICTWENRNPFGMPLQLRIDVVLLDALFLHLDCIFCKYWNIISYCMLAQMTQSEKMEKEEEEQ